MFKFAYYILIARVFKDPESDVSVHEQLSESNKSSMSANKLKKKRLPTESDENHMFLKFEEEIYYKV